MLKGKRIRIVRFAALVLAILFLVSGIRLTETNANELSYGTAEEFFVEEGMENLTTVVFAENGDDTCTNFVFELVDEEGAPVAVEKMDCSKWNADDIWHYKIGALETGTYTYTASDYVSIVAVNGDVDEYLENYALGNGLADVGSCLCCLSFIVPFILGRAPSQTMDSAHHVELNHSFVLPTPYQEPSEGPAPQPATEVQAAEPTTEVKVAESATEVQVAEPTTEDEKEQPKGAFWGGLNDE